MKLHYRKLGQGEPLIILHGLFGSGDNWQTIAKVFAENYEVFLVDQRNHGNSPHSRAFNYDLLADDLTELMDDIGITTAIILGHSMGGKAAMRFAVENPERVTKLIIIDIGPKQYPPHHENVFNGFKSIDLNSIKSRKEADDKLSISIPEMGTRLFILKNLTRNNEGGFAWKVNLESLELNVLEIGCALDPHDAFDGQTLFVGGAKSNYINNDDHDFILNHFPVAEIKMIEGAGHWVHAEKPQELSKVVLSFLKD